MPTPSGSVHYYTVHSTNLRIVSHSSFEIAYSKEYMKVTG